MILTAKGKKADYLEAMDAGADDFIIKPFDAEQLAARLHVAERMLGLRKHVKALEGLLPICAVCKKIRNESNHWVPIESYIMGHSEAKFTHGFCPECKDKVLKQAKSQRHD